MKRSTYVSKWLFIFMLMIIIGSLGAGCKSCKKEEKKEDKEDKENKDENNNDNTITDAMLASVEAAINDLLKGPDYNFLLDVLKNLKENKSVDINATDTNGDTALIYATNVGNADIVKVLIKKGADITKEDRYGRLPLVAAAFYGDKQAVQVLLDTPGIKINATGTDGQTALYAAAEWGYKDIVLLLLDKSGIKVNKVYNANSGPRTALNIATLSRITYGSGDPATAAIYDEIITELTNQGGTL